MNLTETILENATRILLEEGWIQGAMLKYVYQDEEFFTTTEEEDIWNNTEIQVVGRCAEGAICAATTYLKKELVGEEDCVYSDYADEIALIEEIEAAGQKAMELLAFEVEDPEDESYDPRGWPRIPVNNWNDTVGRIFSEIQDGFIEARKHARDVRDV